MGMSRRRRPSDVLFLMPVRMAAEKAPRGKQRILCCDANGKLYTALINKSVYEIAKADTARMERGPKPFAILGLETNPGEFIPTSIDINKEEAWALEHILEHALKNGRLPDILKGHLKPIIQKGAVRREAVIAEFKQRRRNTTPATTPPVLNRLPYYPEHEIEFSVPIYKAAYSYPLIVLKELQPQDAAQNGAANLLIMDSAGDLAVVQVPPKTRQDLEKGFRELKLDKSRNACTILMQDEDRLVVDFIEISRLQRKALDTLTKHYETTGTGKPSISIAAKTVLAKARGRQASPVKTSL